MDVEENKQISEMQTFNDYRNPKSHSSEDYKEISPIMTPARRRRKQLSEKYRPRLKKVPLSDNPLAPWDIEEAFCDKYVPFCLKTYKREMTTIQEEVYHCKHSENPFKEKAYKEKVASLKATVQRLKTMCLTKPEALQNKLPEEIEKLFSHIEI